jgi:glutathione synthase/RimK-type ligase-like ATP-grasp enzyme
MILVLTTEAGDNSHSEFIDWLSYYNADYSVLSGESILRGEKLIEINEKGELIIDNRNYSKDVNVVFNRRWLTTSELSKDILQEKLKETVLRTVSSELYEIRNFLKHSLKKAIWFPSINNLNVNKLNILERAKSVGLNIPEYIVTNKKKTLSDFYNKHNRIITKAIGNFPRNQDSNHIINPIYTKLIDENLIDNLPDTFFVSLFQEHIEKSIEYRVLYFDGEIYPVGILSQENKFSEIDSRSQDTEDDLTRLVPAQLDEEDVLKIQKFMQSIDLNIGCIDIIQSKDNKLFFLEVNPVGQIAGYSKRCNIKFEKNVVKKLIELDNEDRR